MDPSTEFYQEFSRRQIFVGANQGVQSILRFDEIAINMLKARGLSFEPMFTGRPDYWIGP